MNETNQNINPQLDSSQRKKIYDSAFPNKVVDDTSGKQNESNKPIPKNNTNQTLTKSEINKVANTSQNLNDESVPKVAPAPRPAQAAAKAPEPQRVEQRVEATKPPPEPVRIKTADLPEQIIILTIDDDKWMQRIFSQYLTQWGFKHYQASDPFKGLNDAIKYQPHLIFLDIVLPEVGGETVLQFLRNMEYTKNISTVIISGNLNKELIRNTYIHGAKGFITKPFNQEILFNKIKEMMDPALFQKMVDAGRIMPNIAKKAPLMP